jgi:NifU-like protein involved in Fe-S cluster formation
MCGLNYSNGDYIVTIDDDGQNDPIDAKRLVEEAIKNSDIAEDLGRPPVKIHCSVLAEDAIKAAIADIKAKRGA